MFQRTFTAVSPDRNSARKKSARTNSSWRLSSSATTVALRLKMAEGWHTYWQNPGDSGLPTTLTWTLPAGADLISQEERIASYNQVQVGTEEKCGYEESCTTESVYDHTERTCYDDGTCDEHDVYRDERTCTNEYVCNNVPVYESVPVYQTWYTYKIWEWVNIQPAVAQGTDAEIYWPKVQLADNQREGARAESCTVTFTNDKGNEYPYHPICADLHRYRRGSRWAIKRNAYEILEVRPQE